MKTPHPMAAFIAFGPFRLFPAARLLERDDVPVKVGDRAFDLLMTLLAQPGNVVSKDTLSSAIWPDTQVVESALRVHITHLRKALGDGENGARYISNVAGRGYCLVAPAVHGTLDARRSARRRHAPAAGFTATSAPAARRRAGRSRGVQTATRIEATSRSSVSADDRVEAAPSPGRDEA